MFLVLPSSQNDLVISTVAQHCETPSDKLQDNNQEVEQLDVTGPDLISDEHLMKQDNLEAFPVLVLEPPPSQDKISQDEVSQPLELVTSEDKYVFLFFLTCTLKDYQIYFHLFNPFSH